MKRSTDQIGDVLVVDDDPLIRGLLTKIVRREGMYADSAADGYEAIRYLDNKNYDAILLDLMMPRLNGFEVVEHLAGWPPEARPIVIVVTAYGDDEWKDLDPSVVTGVVRKPFEINEMGRILRHCVYRELTESAAIPAFRLVHQRG